MTITQDQQNALLSILYNGKFLTKVADTTKLARKYYNQNKYWCSNINMRSVTGHYKVLRLVLTRDYACTPDTQISNLNNIIKYGPVNKEEAVFYYYYKHHNFFINMLSCLKQAFQSYTERRFYCKCIKLPGDFDWPGLTTHKDKNFTISGEDIMKLFGSMHFIDTPYLKRISIENDKMPIKLPKPSSLKSLHCNPNSYIPNVGNYLFRNNNEVEEVKFT
jgi:hypothetical protein